MGKEKIVLGMQEHQQPLMRQYFSIKEKYPDAILFFRVGDFYEMFGEDAKTASAVLQIALTSRNREKDNPVPMCGVPYFAAESYIARLIKNDYKVALCEQVEDPKQAKGIVKREVVKVITPGTHSPAEPKENAYILSLFQRRGRRGFAAADISTGEFTLYETNNSFEDEIDRFEPREILCPLSFKSDVSFRQATNRLFISYIDDWSFEYTEAYKTLLRHFKVATLSGFGCDNLEIAISAAGALLGYLEDTQKGIVFRKISVFNPYSYMFLDSTTCRNLEITHNMKDGSKEGTLLWIMDETLTPMGGRFLRDAITKPLLDRQQIIMRHNAVESILADYELMEQLRGVLSEIQDIERLTMKISNKTAVPRDLLALRSSLINMPKIKNLLTSSPDIYLSKIGDGINQFDSAVHLIDSAIMENPPLNPADGGIIKDGYSPDIDELRQISQASKEFISRLEIQERQRTSIPSLKVGYNRVFGYYIEVTKPNLALVPPDYIRKQTLVNVERFITEELKEYESKVLGAQNRLKELELAVFQDIIEQMRQYEAAILNSAHLIAIVDFIYSLALIAKKYDYLKPTIQDDDLLEIKGGRHPVVERLISSQAIGFNDRFIPNDTLMDCRDNRLIIITGPNMAGKSTYMRQIALIAIMAQAGSFVPAESAKIGLIDRVFTRIGAVDFIAKGQSTFMVEMTETANIINNSSQKSLILLDEVGRGTSTFDGVSIAWAVAEHLAINIRAKTLFATHYHELTDIVFNVEGAKNYNAVVKEWGDEIIFLRKIEKGTADKSYGIHVAMLAGLPEDVINRSRVILKKLESGGLREHSPARQLNLFFSGDPVSLELIKIDTDSLTPQRALNKLIELKKMAEETV
jgi:DNA mismatch repair protein MutS